MCDSGEEIVKTEVTVCWNCACPNNPDSEYCFKCFAEFPELKNKRKAREKLEKQNGYAYV